MRDGPADDTGAFHAVIISSSPKARQQRQQRNAEDGEIVAIDLIEELNA